MSSFVFRRWTEVIWIWNDYRFKTFLRYINPFHRIDFFIASIPFPDCNQLLIFRLVNWIWLFFADMSEKVNSGQRLRRRPFPSSSVSFLAKCFPGKMAHPAHTINNTFLTHLRTQAAHYLHKSQIRTLPRMHAYSVNYYSHELKGLRKWSFYLGLTIGGLTRAYAPVSHLSLVAFSCTWFQRWFVHYTFNNPVIFLFYHIAAVTVFNSLRIPRIVPSFLYPLSPHF